MRVLNLLLVEEQESVSTVTKYLHIGYCIGSNSVAALSRRFDMPPKSIRSKGLCTEGMINSYAS